MKSLILLPSVQEDVPVPVKITAYTDKSFVYVSIGLSSYSLLFIGCIHHKVMAGNGSGPRIFDTKETYGPLHA